MVKWDEIPKTGLKKSIIPRFLCRFIGAFKLATKIGCPRIEPVLIYCYP